MEQVGHAISLICLLSTGSGIPGGFLVPMFALGGLLGAIESSIFISVGILDPIFSNNIVTAAMAAFVTASMRSPITSVLLILELTGDFSHLTTLVLASAIAYVTSALVTKANANVLLMQNEEMNKHLKPCGHFVQRHIGKTP